MPTRCAWARTPLSIAYHDAEWGIPVHDDRVLFEFLVLEGAQAGLSWETILKKRAAYRVAFSGFDPAKVARFTPARIERLLRNPGIVRNRLKVASAVSNARTFRRVQREFGSFDSYLWNHLGGGGGPRVNRRRSLSEIPSRTTESDALSRDLLDRGFRFVGSTICYAFRPSGASMTTRLTATGMYTRETFEQLRVGVRQRERRDGLLLALVSVGLGLGQLGLHPWVDSRFPRRTAVAIEAGGFLVYAAIVIWLLWRMQRHKRLGAPRCPQCGRALQGMSERVAGATGRCDACGGQVLA